MKPQLIQLGKIMGFKDPDVSIEDYSFSIEGKRDMGPMIFIPTRIPVNSTTLSDISFKFFYDEESNWYIQGELSVLQEEVQIIAQELIKNGMTITAIHNHELLIKPLPIYIHFYSTLDPEIFSYTMSKIFNIKSPLFNVSIKSLLS